MPLPPRFEEIVRNRCAAAGATGVVIGPGLDIPLLIGIWAEGTLRIASRANVVVSEDAVSRMVSAVFSSSANWLVSGLMLDALTMAIPGINVAVNGVVNSFYTYRYLRTVALVFDQSGAAGLAMVENGASLVLGGLSDHAPHVLARDALELARLFR